MERLLSGPFITILVFVALALFAWTFWDLLQETRDGGAGTAGARRPSWRRGASNKPSPPSPGFEPTGAPPPGGRESLQFSRTVETWIDRDSGDLRGRIVAGPYRGRGLETLSRADCVRLDEYCRRADPEAARLLQAYLGGRFGADFRTKFRSGQSPRAPSDGAMTRQAAYEALGLASGAQDQEIIKAHRALIKKFHPDHGGSTAAAARINQAKDVLLEKRG